MLSLCISFLPAILCNATGSLDSLRRMYSQASTKSEQSEILGRLAFELSKTNPDSALLLARKGLSLGIDGHSAQGVSDCMNAAGWSYYTLGRDDSAVFCLDSAAHMFHKAGAIESEARTLINLSCVYNRQKHYEQALACLLPARRLLERGADVNAKAYAALQIGIVYRQQGQYDKALLYLRSAVADFRKAGADSYVADALSSLGGLYIYLDQPDSSLRCYGESLRIFQSLGNAYGAGLAYENAGDACLIKAQHAAGAGFLDSALQCYGRALRIFTSIHDASDAMYERLNIGKTYRRMKRYDAANPALEAAFCYFDSTAATNNAYDAAQELAALYKELRRFDEALHYTEIVQRYKDTLYARNRSGDMAEMLARYETERKDQTIRLLNTQQQLYRQQLSRSRVILGFSGLLILLGAALAFVAFSRNRIRRQLHDVSLRNQLARDLHDDVGSSLSSILLLSTMSAGEGIAGADMQQRIIDRIAGTSRDIMERMSDIVWSMNPKYDRFINLKEKIETHLAHLREATGMRMQVQVAEDIAGLKLSTELRKNLFLIVKEAVNNALKYASATQLLIRIFKEEGGLCMKISDDGQGFDPAQASAGTGLDSIRQRAAAGKGSCDIRSAPGGGTEIIIRAPLTYIR